MTDKQSNKFKLRKVKEGEESSVLPYPKASSCCPSGLSLRTQEAKGVTKMF